jgi:hypothetical protein
MNFHRKSSVPRACVFCSPVRAKLWMLFPSRANWSGNHGTDSFKSLAIPLERICSECIQRFVHTYVLAALSLYPGGAAWAAIRFAIRIGPPLENGKHTRISRARCCCRECISIQCSLSFVGCTNTFIYICVVCGRLFWSPSEILSVELRGTGMEREHSCKSASLITKRWRVRDVRE